MRRGAECADVNESALLALLEELVEIESPTYSPGVRAVAERVGRELVALGADVSVLAGDHLAAELPGGGPPLLVLGHTDTVWPEAWFIDTVNANGVVMESPSAWDWRPSRPATASASSPRSRWRRSCCSPKPSTDSPATSKPAEDAFPELLAK